MHCPSVPRGVLPPLARQPVRPRPPPRQSSTAPHRDRQLCCRADRAGTHAAAAIRAPPPSAPPSAAVGCIPRRTQRRRKCFASSSASYLLSRPAREQPAPFPELPECERRSKDQDVACSPYQRQSERDLGRQTQDLAEDEKAALLDTQSAGHQQGTGAPRL